MSKAYSFSLYNTTLLTNRAIINMLRDKIWIIPCKDMDHVQIMAMFTQCLEGCMFWLQIFHFKEGKQQGNQQFYRSSHI